ncbi:hypothetical protein ElyMa_000659400 [Elysia marginata]|uniref:Uncharacterized protein n=1 Tax=Elysia marginata TaxID=1093978 RepID=A0AAV4GEH1_9GAST|nr:hypothetical protein ElyMa_000659400 [Elysia marginata]
MKKKFAFTLTSRTSTKSSPVLIPGRKTTEQDRAITALLKHSDSVIGPERDGAGWSGTERTERDGRSFNIGSNNGKNTIPSPAVGVTEIVPVVPGSSRSVIIVMVAVGVEAAAVVVVVVPGSSRSKIIVVRVVVVVVVVVVLVVVAAAAAVVVIVVVIVKK